MQRLINEILERAKADRQRIVLPEGTEERTLKAANQILTDGIADLILLGNPAEINACATEWGLGNISKATIIDPENNPKQEEYAQLLFELRKKKGMTIEEARKLVTNPLYLGCLIIKNGDADGQLAGARNTTGDVLRPALQIIKTAPGITCVSGAMLLLTHAPEYGKNGVLVMGDVAVTPVPDASQLAQIAVCTARTAKAVAGLDPKVALLSFSTKGSAKHEVVDKVVEALKIAKESSLDLVEVSPNAEPPVCKIINYGKYKYEQQKKKAEAKKNQKTIEVKEIQLRPMIGSHDLEIKTKAVRRFIEEGNKVKISKKPVPTNIGMLRYFFELKSATNLRYAGAGLPCSLKNTGAIFSPIFLPLLNLSTINLKNLR